MIIFICFKCGNKLSLVEGAKPVKCSCGSYRFRRAEKSGKFIDKRPGRRIKK